MDTRPGTPHKVVVQDREGRRILRPMVWGLVRRDLHAPEPPTHARAETLLDRPMFRDLLRGKRCIVPMRGWFDRGSFVSVEGESILGIAGLYDAWANSDQTTTETFCAITVVAEAEIRHLNTRRPAIIRREDEELWLSRRECDIERVLAALHAFDGTFSIGRSRDQNEPSQQTLDLMPRRLPD